MYPGSRCLSRCRCDELPCPLLSWLYSGGSGDVLLAGELKNVLSNISSPLSLVRNRTFLVSELQAARIIKYKESHPDERATEADSEKEQRVEDLSRDFCEENEGDDGSGENRRKAEMQAEWILLLRRSLQTFALMQVNARLSRLPSGDMTNPLLSSSLSSEQWVRCQDYRRRRQMMVTRFQVTLESFAWGEKQKERSAALASAPNLASLIGSSQVSPSLLLAAREDQSFIDPVKAGTSTSVYKTLMGSVPDRGGRPGEIEPPMPAWTGRSSKGNRGGRGGGQSHKHKKKKGKKD
uniref:Im:7138535 n=1 Tax=Oreochromis niloticus TaxID=8128 RepID=A0A669E9R4_ORENI